MEITCKFPIMKMLLSNPTTYSKGKNSGPPAPKPRERR